MTGSVSREEGDYLREEGRSLLQEIGFGGDVSIDRLTGGRNNRVYHVSDGRHQALVKSYFHHADDQRDRLNAEYSLCVFARGQGIDSVPEPLARNDDARLAAYSWLEGRRLTRGEVNAYHVDQAIEFLRVLNVDRESGRNLPAASEACFSLQQHVDRISQRVARLADIAAAGQTYRDASQFVRQRIVPVLPQRVALLTSWAKSTGIDLSGELSADQQCISPSDFGFHNALLRSDGRLAFVDFEYAGWDDPAKMICDFYCQPELPAPRETWDRFYELTVELAGDSTCESEYRERLLPLYLLPLYQIKWCCILLNEFAVADRARRQFAESGPTALDESLQNAIRFADSCGI